MPTQIPTQKGDVLILRTNHTFRIHAVGAVSQNGQQDFNCHPDVQHLADGGAAVAVAKAAVQRGQRIFLVDIDNGQWSQVSSA